MALIAAVLGLAMPTCGHAQEVVLQFWDNQQTESGLSQYQQEAVKRFEAENPGHQGRGDDDPLSGVPAAAADRRAGRQRAGRLDGRPDLGRGLRRGRRDRAARRAGGERRRSARHLLPRRLGFGELRRRALGHPVQRRRLAVQLLQQGPARGGAAIDPATHGDLRGAEGGRREADRRGKRQVRRRPVRPQGRGHRRRDATASSSPTAARCWTRTARAR